MNDTQVCNLALAEVGDSYSLTDINETSNQAAVCRLFFEPTRDYMLREHPWNFARQLSALSRLADAPPFGWDNQFQLPADFLRLVEFNGLDVWQVEGSYQVANGPSGGLVLMTDDNRAEIIYVKRITDANLFDPLFVDALAKTLAARISTKISKDESVKDRLVAQAKAALGKAKQTDANESRPRRAGLGWESDLVTSRFW